MHEYPQLPPQVRDVRKFKLNAGQTLQNPGPGGVRLGPGVGFFVRDLDGFWEMGVMEGVNSPICVLLWKATAGDL